MNLDSHQTGRNLCATEALCLQTHKLYMQSDQHNKQFTVVASNWHPKLTSPNKSLVHSTETLKHC